MNQIINGLWVGPHLSPLELLCIKSFLDHGHIFHLWTYRDLELPNWEGLVQKDANEILKEAFVFRYKKGNAFGHGKGSLAGFFDVFRYQLLWKKGGWWSDMNICCLKPLDMTTDNVFRSHDVLPVVGNLMKCPAQSPLMHFCFQKAVKEVTSDNEDWLRPVKILNEGVKKFGLQSFILNPLSNHDRWEVVNYHRFFYGKKRKPYYVFHWMHEEWRARQIKKTEVIEGSFLAAKMAEHGIAADVMPTTSNAGLLAVLLRKWTIPLIPYPVRRYLKTMFYMLFKNKKVRDW